MGEHSHGKFRLDNSPGKKFKDEFSRKIFSTVREHPHDKFRRDNTSEINGKKGICVPVH